MQERSIHPVSRSEYCKQESRGQLSPRNNFLDNMRKSFHELIEMLVVEDCI